MDYVTKLLNEITYNNLQIIMDELKTKRIGIWGTGQAGKMIFTGLQKNGIDPLYFVDNNRDKLGKKYCGKSIVGIESLGNNDCIIIAANFNYGIHKQLERANIGYMYLDPVAVWAYDQDNPEYARTEINKHKDEIQDVFALLMDPYSKQVYYNVLLHRAVHDMHLIWSIYDEHQYFGNGVVKTVAGNFVDCGAYQGDTLLQFMNQVGKNKYKYFAFEADKNNFEKLIELYKTNHWNVQAYNLGVWDGEDCICFENDAISDAGVGGKLVKDADDSTIMIKTNSLDQVLGDEKIDFIKMDIEGAEIKALEGAKSIIQRNVPQLAISAYHQLSHLWEVPLLINRINPKYELQLAQHMWNQADTVCYATIKK